jgi:hypothetical protein
MFNVVKVESVPLNSSEFAAVALARDAPRRAYEDAHRPQSVGGAAEMWMFLGDHIHDR